MARNASGSASGCLASSFSTGAPLSASSSSAGAITASGIGAYGGYAGSYEKPFVRSTAKVVPGTAARSASTTVSASFVSSGYAASSVLRCRS